MGRLNINYRVEGAVLERQAFRVADPELKPIDSMHRTAEIDGVFRQV